jgi:hypothetical protein
MGNREKSCIGYQPFFRFYLFLRKEAPLLPGSKPNKLQK